VQDRLAAEHAGELLGHTLEHLLDGGAVADEVDGHLEKVHMMRSGYSSRILEIKRVPIPEPVPPPREWVSWKP
jgi:hypothetical protein